jgi:hypothetical protein
MKKYLIPIMFISILFVQCGSKQSAVQKKVPFEITEKTYQVMVGGREETGNSVRLRITGELKEFGVQFVAVFFHNKEIPVKTIINDKTFIIDVMLHEPQKKDFNMSSDATGEYGNEPPKTGDEDFPFKLNEDEAVIQYHVVGKEYYHKVTGIKKLDSVTFE